MKFNEDSRVKIPSILHLIRLGYSYLSLKDQEWDKSTNIFTGIFSESIQRINPLLESSEVTIVFNEVALSLENEDLGKAFYEKLISKSGTKLIDFENFDNNSFHVVTELPYEKDDDNFRPDIILLINGMPLFFIEVKKPNNRNGILDEHKRIKTRFKNKSFRNFVNITQLMVFSNNMEYDDSSPNIIEGAFYASSSYREPIFNYFREDPDFKQNLVLPELEDETELFVLKDTNYASIRNSPEFATNKNPETPTNRISTSLFSRDRVSFLLQYAFAYVKESSGLQKHVMRYPQIFATKAIEQKLSEGTKKGIIWHTQGSGKTALAYYNVKYLTDYYQKKGVIPKFYFIVDRLDLLTQASREFKARGLVVYHVSSKEAFAKDIKSNSAIHNDQGKPEITVVNIHKFKDDPDVTRNTDYNIGIQRVYFLDEVHRSYNPKGSFLANLKESDPNAVKIGLTGTPLLGSDYNSKMLFGDYIHKYYYNASIADGYTLRLIREEIDTQYKLKLQETLDQIKLLQGSIKKQDLFAHQRFVEDMLAYIVKDFRNARVAMNDDSIGAMIICDSSPQAQMMFEVFQKQYAENIYTNLMAADDESSDRFVVLDGYSDKKMTARLILHDYGSRQDQKDWVEEFKDGKVDFLFVYNMLLTGFDAPRLKKLYVGRVIKSHNLLQALTRVNRTYKDFRYGNVVDFADIQSEFDKTNKAYFDELQLELGDEMEHYSNLFKSTEEIEQEINEIRSVLLYFDTENAEVFSQQITEIEDRAEMLKITRALNNAKALYNLIRLSGNYELLEKLDFRKLTILSREADNHLALINTKESLENNVDSMNLLNVALEDVIFTFTKVSEEEMVLADELKNTLQKTREMLGNNFDPIDPEFISLKEELERLFKKKKLTEVTKDEMEANIKELDTIFKKAKELERKNNLVKAKYENDEKYARLHKRLMEKDPLTDNEAKLFEVLQDLKREVDTQILQNSNMLENKSFVQKMMGRIVVDQLKNKHHLTLDLDITKRINTMIINEYMNEYYGRVA